MEKIYNSQFNFSENKPKLLLHICCAPDLIVPLLDLKKYFKLYLFWYNPNIQPYSEYARRYKEYIKVLQLEEWDYEIIQGQFSTQKLEKVDKTEILKQKEIFYDGNEFYRKLYKYKNKVDLDWNYSQLMKEFSRMEEKNSPRCDICYYFRLLEPALVAKKLWMPYFTTTLLISPKKSVEKLDKWWKIVTQETWVKYLTFDFRKNNGFKRAADYTKQNNIRRQNYCGCAWSIRK